MDFYNTLFAKALSSGNAPTPTPVINELNVNANGTYTAPEGVDGYSPVNVNVPNSYTSSDEGKVVDNGALVSQTAYPTEITVNDTYDTTLYNSITVNVPTGGGSGVEEKDVNFYDYDGTCVYAYTKAEFLALTEMPANPSHDGLTAQGWNWSFSDATTYVTSYGKLNVGQMYVTSDGKTRLYITLNEGRLKPYLGLTGKSSGTAVSINWGDNSTAESVTLNTNTVYTPHEYATAGDYVIAITVTNGKISFNGSSSYGSDILRKSLSPNQYNDNIYQNALKELKIGNNVLEIGNYAFYNCKSLSLITIPDITYIYNSTFTYCSSLKSITIPNRNVSSIGTSALSATRITSIAIPKTVTSIASSAFSSCGVLTSITIPNSVTVMDTSAFSGCTSLSSIQFPNSVTYMGVNLFSATYGLGFIKFSSSAPPRAAATSAFTFVSTDCIIYVPALVSNLYMTAQYYPNPAYYTYIGYATYTSGDTLPTLTTDETYTLTWYATVDDAIAGTNPITEGNGNEVYSRATAVV